jgi:hypothetical protein
VAAPHLQGVGYTSFGHRALVVSTIPIRELMRGQTLCCLLATLLLFQR